MVNLFEFDEIFFAYPGNSLLLEKFSLAIKKGEFVAIVGPNGAGKSTFIKLCVGLLKPRSGDIRILGVPLPQFNNWPKMGYIPQGTLYNRNFPATVREVIAMGRVAPLGIGQKIKKQDYEIIDQALELVGLEEYRNFMITELSGGQLQRVLIARALAAQPDILILDEATSGVDSKAKDEIYGLLKKMNNKLKLSILMVSHDVEQVLQYVDTVISINHGLQYYGDAHEFRKKNLGEPGYELFTGEMRGNVLHA